MVLTLLRPLWEDLRYLDDRIEELDGQIQSHVDRDPIALRLSQLRGIGPLTASALSSALSDPSHFHKGRDFAASLGLTPRQHSSGGKPRLLGISKRGDSYLRQLLVHGARAVIRHCRYREDRLSCWLKQLLQKKHVNVVVVTLANKTARIAWAMVHEKSDYLSLSG